MKDLTKLTPDEANKIECLLLTLSQNVADTIEAYDKLSKDEDFSETQRKLFKSNSEWFRECYELLYEEPYKAQKEEGE